jgi:hypothetical protein
MVSLSLTAPHPPPIIAPVAAPARALVAYEAIALLGLADLAERLPIEYHDLLEENELALHAPQIAFLLPEIASHILFKLPGIIVS